MIVNAAVETSQLLVGGAAFTLVMALWLAALLIWNAHHERQDKKIEERLRQRPEQEGNTRLLRLWTGGQEATTTVPETHGRREMTARLALTLQRAGWDMPPERFILLVTFCCGVAAFFSLLFTMQLWLAVTVPIGGLLILNIYIQHKISQWETLFERQFLDSMQVAASSLRAGHPLSGALQFVSAEVDAPVGEIFGEIWEQQELGVDLQQAVSKAAERSGSKDMKLFASSIAVQLRSGGNIADMMDRLASVIRDRVKRRRRLRVITAQTQFSKRALLAFPFIFLVVMNVIYPGYTDPLFETTGGKITAFIAGTLLLIGAWIMNRMTRLET
ncbi:MAG: type II secretion system F family protein [Planctomycetota bacterium]